MGQFSLDISQWVQKTKAKQDLLVRRVAMDVFRRILALTPVGNPKLWKHAAPPGYVGGRLKNNWQLSIGNPATGTLDGVDPTGEGAASAAEAAVAAAMAGDTVFIINNLPYAVVCEWGHSEQAPAGMVRITIAEFQRLVDEAVGSLKAGGEDR